jgi:hypothetical protein
MTTTPTATGTPEEEPERYLRLVPGGLAEPDTAIEPAGPGTDLEPGDDAEVLHVGEVIEGVPVDADDVPLTTTWATITTRPRVPIIPRWMRDQLEFRARVRVAADLAGYTFLFYLTRTPKYAAKTAWYAPQGLYRTVGRIIHWASAEEGNWNLRQHAATSNDAYTWQALNRTRSKEARGRWWLVIPAALVLAVTLMVLTATDAPATEPDRRPIVWPVLILCLPAFVAIWGGWVEMGRLTGFGMVKLLPGIADRVELNTAITLPIGVETYAAFALWAWLSGRATGDARAFAKWSALASLGLGAAGQVAYHLMAAAGWTSAPWPITAAVSCIPVAVLGMGAALAHLMHHKES